MLNLKKEHYTTLDSTTVSVNRLEWYGKTTLARNLQEYLKTG